MPDARQIEADALTMVRSIAWRGAQERIRGYADQVAEATELATKTAMTAWAAMPKREMRNKDEYEAGQRHAERWRPMLHALTAILNLIDERLPDGWLAAVSEEDLRELADFAATRAACLAAPRPRAIQGTARREPTPAERRSWCPRHHRRQLRRRAAIARQHLSAILGTIGKGGPAYADGFALGVWKERQAAARAFGQAHFLQFADGQTVNLWEVMESSRKARFASTYAQTLGLDGLSKKRSLLPIFLTVTLPPRYHPNPKHGRPFGGVPLAEAPTPFETDRALSQTWARLRARLAASGITPLGLRVVEPHQDGCPHLHALLYVENREQIEATDRHLQALCPEPVAGQRIASKLVEIDRSRAAPATYIMKYLLKTVAGWEDAATHADGVERDGDPDHLAHLPAVAAWASERHLRRFAWVGLHGLRTVWQRFARMNEGEDAAAPSAIREIRAAIATGDWAAAIEGMGAIRSDKKDRPKLAYEERENQYGEKVKRPTAVTLADWTIPLRKQACQIVAAGLPAHAPAQVPAPSVQEDGEPRFTVTESFPRGPSCKDIDGGGVGRTGPPAPQWMIDDCRHTGIVFKNPDQAS